MSSVELLHPAIQHHIVNSLGWRDLRPFQEQAIQPVLQGEHAVILAPTAGGKTEAALFPLLSRMLQEDWRGLSLLYVCPLRALLNNLLPRLERFASLVGRRVEVWHGDVAETARRRIRKDPPDILLTTPESLEVMLVSSRTDKTALFGNVHAAVVDELHSFAGDDRGWHLLAVLERISKFADREIQRVGLSATVGNPEELLGWLAGSSTGPKRVIRPPETSVKVEAEVSLDFVGTLENAALLISELHRGEKRLVFADSRARVEELAASLRSKSVATFVSHSSLSADERRQAETAFAERSDCVIVATSTLELGIDVGDLDRVIQIDAPTTVASFLQRLGRTGRRADTTRNCLFLATSDEALLRAAGLVELWSAGFVEPIVPPVEPLHILAQQVMALALQQGGIGRRSWRDWICGVSAFAAISESDAEAIIAHMISRDLLFDDAGILWFGEKGERQFGYKNFLELFSVFTTPPLFHVLSGRIDLGQVHESSFQLRGTEPVILLLAGRSWHVTHVDWRRRVVQVEPSKDRGKSRWIGPSAPLGFELCRSIRGILSKGRCAAPLSRRAAAKLEEVLPRFSWIDDESTQVVRDAADSLTWWTFAGMRANAVLSEALGPLARSRSRIDNLSIPLEASCTFDELNARLRDVDAEVTAKNMPISPDAIEGLKFSVCLPQGLAERMLARRLSDTRGAGLCIAEARRAIQVAG